jgi:Methylase involved in ubiquinone/menaquinone biosynthesis
MNTQMADYGLDAPGIVRTMGTTGFLLIIFATLAPVGRGLESAGLSMGISLLISAILMIASSRIGKLKARNSLLAAMALKPTDKILDVGCGRGLLLVGAALRTIKGHATGIDLWSQRDQHNNSRNATLRNAEAEGVADRIDVLDGDMRSLPFETATFDVVVSSLAIHNLKGEADRDLAILEIARVLKPGGRVGILDIANVGHYASTLESVGVRVTSGPRFTPWIFPPARVLVAAKE